VFADRSEVDPWTLKVLRCSLHGNAPQAPKVVRVHPCLRVIERPITALVLI
jgi:hypothetical protein